MPDIKGDAYIHNVYFNMVISITLPWIVHE